ncbi:MAG: hypothetical protein IH598_14800 [Bacteroidales bacterium]|nr:hypothetical protein [Bacteroidales bacterium]
MASAYIGDRGILRQQVEKIKKKISFSVNQFDRSTLENQPAKSISGNDVDGTIKPSATDADNLKDVSTLDEIVNVESIIGVQDNSRLTGELTKTANQSKSKEELIDQFIENAPRIIRSKSDFFDPDEIAKSSQKDNEQIVSETLAQIYHKQGKTDKAIKIYRKLTVTNPEKSSYFAALIEKIISEQNLNT